MITCNCWQQAGAGDRNLPFPPGCRRMAYILADRSMTLSKTDLCMRCMHPTVLLILEFSIGAKTENSDDLLAALGYAKV